MKGLDPLTRVEIGSVDSGIYINATSPAYAVDPTGVSDSSAGIQQALDDAVAIGAQTVYLPDGNYRLTTTLTVGTTAGFTSIGLLGSGGLVGTTLTWDGSTSGIAVKIVRGRNNHIRDVSIVNGVAIGTTIGLLFTGPAAGSQCSGCHLERVTIRDFKVNCQAGEVSVNSSASELLFEDCNFDGTGGSGGTGFLNPTANSLVNLFVGCGFSFLDFGIDIQAGGCTHVVGGGFSRGGVYMRVATAAATLLAYGQRFELDPTDIIIQTTNPCSVRLEGALIAANSTVPTNSIIQGKGQFALLNNTVGQGSDTGWKVIEVDTQGTNGSLEMAHNKVWGTELFQPTFSSAGLLYRLYNNERWAAGVVHSRFDDEEGRIDGLAGRNGKITVNTLTSAAIQAAIDRLVGGEIHLRPADYVVSASLLIENKKGFHLRGEGASDTGTRLTWAGNNSTPLLRVFGVRDSIFENFYIKSLSSAPLDVAVKSETRSGSAMTNNTYRNIIIEGTDLNGLGTGFEFVAGTGGDANNAENVFQSVTINNYTNFAWDFQHGQSTAHKFYAVNATAAASATTSGGINSVAGVSYQVYGANLNGAGEAEIIWAGANQGLTLVGIFSETSSRFLKTSVSTSSVTPVKIIGGSWNNNNINADGRVIDFQMRGPLSIEGWAIVGNPATAAAIYFDAGANGTWGFSVKDCVFTTSLTPTTMFTQDQPNRIMDCTFVGASTVLVPYKSNNVDATPSFESLGVGTSGHSIPGGIKALIDGVQRIRESSTVTRYRADIQVSASGVVYTVHDDTGAVYKPFIILDSSFEVWPGAVQANRVQVDGSGNLQAVNGHIEALGSGKMVRAVGGLGVGNSASATTPGTVVKKMEVFDASGASLGFIPIYDAIT